MKAKQVLFCKDLINDKYEFLDEILKNCDIDKLTGRLYCKKCKTHVNIDWARDQAFCTMHIISRLGIILKEVNYEIYI